MYLHGYRNTKSLSQGKLADGCIILSVLKHDTLTQFCLVSRM